MCFQLVQRLSPSLIESVAAFICPDSPRSVAQHILSRPQMIIWATPCPPSVLLPWKAWPLKPASA